MSSEFELRCCHSGTVLLFSGTVPRGVTGYDDCTFNVSLSGGPVSARLKVVDIQPFAWAEFFGSLAQDWRGWSGQRSHESLEGHIGIAASIDSLGHVKLRVALAGGIVEDGWRVECKLWLEAGQLDRVAKNAIHFFGARH